ncbi:MAG: hypothetical protein ACFFAO_18490 [Candidatus Hermodarchaeota archaeon]
MDSRIEKHQSDYKDKVWRQYTLLELGTWIHLFNKRAKHRSNPEKAKKDLYDAKNYLWMLEQKLRNTAAKLEIDYDSL